MNGLLHPAFFAASTSANTYSSVTGGYIDSSPAFRSFASLARAFAQATAA
jgi:hypothetical protein